jgi:hypothetical protein
MDEPTEDKIPYTTHYVWLTNPSQPKEMTDMIDSTENIGYSHHIRITMNTLKKYNFKTYLWTNSITSLPKTKEWAES